MKLLVANRGEIAIRIVRAAAELGIPTVAIYPADDAGSLHTGKADEAFALEGVGTAAYLDLEQIIGVARAAGCDAIHPGYGFLAENADFARRCAEEGLTYIGPKTEALELFGDKARARAAATAAGVPIVRGLDHAVSLEEAAAFFDDLGSQPGQGRAMMIKAVAAGAVVAGRGWSSVPRRLQPPMSDAAPRRRPRSVRARSMSRSSSGRRATWRCRFSVIEGDAADVRYLKNGAAKAIRTLRAADAAPTDRVIGLSPLQIQRRFTERITQAAVEKIGAGVVERLRAGVLRHNQLRRYEKEEKNARVH